MASIRSPQRSAISLLCVAALFAAPAPAQDDDRLPGHPRLWVGGKGGAISLQQLQNRKEGDYAEARKNLSMLEGMVPKALRVLMGDADEALLGELKEALRGPSNPDSESLLQRAVAYDWIHGRLKLDERREISKRLLEDAETLRRMCEKQFNAYRNDSVAMPVAIAAAAYAGYDEDPRGKAMTRWYKPYLQKFVEVTGDGAKPEDAPGRAGLGGGWPEGFGFDRKASRLVLMGLWAIRSATGEDLISNSQFWKDKIQYLLYGTLPDGKRLYPGDDVDRPIVTREDRETMLMLQAAFKDPHAQTWLKECGTPTSGSAPFDLIFSNAQFDAKPLSDLPTAKHFPGIGLAVMRTGWGAADTMLTFRASDWFTEHQHNAQNVFTIYRGAPLAVEPGVFSGRLDPHHTNWRVRTASHNGILVSGVVVEVKGPPGLSKLEDDGGQLVQQWRGDPTDLASWRAQSATVPRDIVDWLGFKSTPEYDIVGAHAGRAYPTAKVTEAARVLFFVKPDWIVVVDRVRLTDAKLAASAITHLAGEVAVNDKKRFATMDVGDTRLTVYPLWPEDAAMKLHPGQGAEEAPAAPVEGQVATASMLSVTAAGKDATRMMAVAYHLGPARKPPPAAPTVEKVISKYMHVKLDKKRQYEIRLDPPTASPYK